ncbi:MAG TPA: TonB-dependent receptor [Gemmatimonadaceae bacterium]|nr:TonB-dependent receptor [Gemmatimonadaceae bacterium]
MPTRIHLTVAAVLAAAVPFSPGAAQGRAPITVAGTVTDASTGAPLSGVVVRIRLTTVYETFGIGADGRVTSQIRPVQGPRARESGDWASPPTGVDGRFRITLGSPGNLAFTRTGYAFAERAITKSDTALVIALSPLGNQGTRAETAQSLERLTVSAVRASGAAPIAQTTLDRAELERDYSGQDVPLSLRLAPSVTAYSESGSLLNYSYFRVRGIDQSRVAITLDGIPLNEPEDQQIYFSDFPDLTNSVQSMQVQRGVGTSTYGQAAYGGSVNFATHSLTGTPRSSSLEVGGGSFGMARATLQANSGALSNRFAFHGRASGMRADGYRYGATSAANSVFASAGYFGDRDLVKLTATTGLERNGQAYAAVPESDLVIDPRTNPLDGVGDKYRESFASLSWTHLLSTDVSAGVTGYGFTTRGFYDYPSGAPGPALRYNSASRWGGIIAAAHAIKGRLTIDGGAHGMTYSKDHEFIERPDLGYPGYSNTGFKTEGSAFGKASYAMGSTTVFGDLQVRTAEFRYLPTEGYGLEEVSERWNFVNPKVGVTVRAAERVTLFASYGTTGREPTRSDLFAGADDVTPDDAPALLPLTRVKPEHVNDLEGGATVDLDRLGITLNVFDMRFRDEIARTGATTPLGYEIRANVGSSYRRGIEVDAIVALTSSVDLGASMTVSNNRIDAYTDEGTGTTYSDVEPILTPAFLATQRLTWRAHSRLTLTADGRYQGLSYLAPVGDERLTSPAFFVLDGGLRYDLGGTTLSVYGRNLLERRAYPSGDVSGGVPRYFILAPRSVDVTLTVRR